MGLLSELNKARTSMAKKTQKKIDAEVKHMIKTFENNINNPDEEGSFFICPQGNDIKTFYPESISKFGLYLEKIKQPIFQIVYFDEDGSSVSTGITYEYDNCEHITIDNQTPKDIAENIGALFTEKTKDITLNISTVEISFEEVFDNGSIGSYGHKTISKESLFVIKDAVEKHVGEFKPIASHGYVFEWKNLSTSPEYTHFYGIEFTINSPAPLKRKRE